MAPDGPIPTMRRRAALPALALLALPLAACQRDEVAHYRVPKATVELPAPAAQEPAAWWRKLFFAHLRFHLPWLGRWSCGDPDAYAYILTSLEHYPAQRGVQKLMETAGYQECGFAELAGGAMAINFGVKPRSSY